MRDFSTHVYWLFHCHLSANHSTDNSDQRLSEFLNQDLKLLCSIRLLLNTDQTCTSVSEVQLYGTVEVQLLLLLLLITVCSF